MAENQQVPVDTKYLPELMAEKDSIDPSFVHAVRLISQEIDRIQNPNSGSSSDDKPSGGSNKELTDTNDGKPVKQTILLKVPIDRYPNFNFVGRLLGPGGSTLKSIQSTTSTQIAILGKGSMRDKKKAEELAAGGDAKYHHLNLPLHVKVTCVSPLDVALMNIGAAASELLKLMQPQEDEMSAQGGRGGGMGQRGGMRGRGGRGGAGQRGATRGGGMRGGRGGASSQRGATGGRGRGAAGGRGGFGAKTQDPYGATSASAYDYSAQESYEGYGAEYAAEAATYDAYGNETYGDLYAADGGYGDAAYGADAYGYGDASSYDAYGNGADASAGGYGGAGQAGSKPFRGKMRGGTGRGRASSKPY